MRLDLDGGLFFSTEEVPSLFEMRLPPAVLEAARETASLSDTPGLEDDTLELLLRVVF